MVFKPFHFLFYGDNTMEECAFDLEEIRKNEDRLRKKYGKSARDLDREGGHEFIEVCDIPKKLQEVIAAKNQYVEKNSEVENIIRSIAGDCFTYYPEGWADNYVGDEYDSGVDLFGYRGDVIIRVERKIEDEKIEDFCTRTNLKLVDVRFDGSLLSNRGDYTYVFGYEHGDEIDEECEYCSCC